MNRSNSWLITIISAYKRKEAGYNIGTILS